MNRIAVTLFFVCFCYGALGATLGAGTYVQCDFETGDLSTITLDDNLEGTLHYVGGGCTGDVHYELNAGVSFDLSGSNGGLQDVEFDYDFAEAIARDNLGQVFLEETCGGSFPVDGSGKNVLNCLFCGGKQYDILQATSNGFFLGNGPAACKSSQRPSELSIYEFVDSNENYYGGNNSGSAVTPALFAVLAMIAVLL